MVRGPRTVIISNLIISRYFTFLLAPEFRYARRGTTKKNQKRIPQNLPAGRQGLHPSRSFVMRVCSPDESGQALIKLKYYSRKGGTSCGFNILSLFLKPKDFNWSPAVVRVSRTNMIYQIRL